MLEKRMIEFLNSLEEYSEVEKLNMIKTGILQFDFVDAYYLVCKYITKRNVMGLLV